MDWTTNTIMIGLIAVGVWVGIKWNDVIDSHVELLNRIDEMEERVKAIEPGDGEPEENPEKSA